MREKRPDARPGAEVTVSMPIFDDSPSVPQNLVNRLLLPDSLLFAHVPWRNSEQGIGTVNPIEAIIRKIVSNSHWLGVRHPLAAGLRLACPKRKIKPLQNMVNGKYQRRIGMTASLRMRCANCGSIGRR